MEAQKFTINGIREQLTLASKKLKSNSEIVTFDDFFSGGVYIKALTEIKEKIDNLLKILPLMDNTIINNESILYNHCTNIQRITDDIINNQIPIPADDMLLYITKANNFCEKIFFKHNARWVSNYKLTSVKESLISFYNKSLQDNKFTEQHKQRIQNQLKAIDRAISDIQFLACHDLLKINNDMININIDKDKDVALRKVIDNCELIHKTRLTPVKKQGVLKDLDNIYCSITRAKNILMETKDGITNKLTLKCNEVADKCLKIHNVLLQNIDGITCQDISSLSQLGTMFVIIHSMVDEIRSGNIGDVIDSVSGKIERLCSGMSLLYNTNKKQAIDDQLQNILIALPQINSHDAEMLRLNIDSLINAAKNTNQDDELKKISNCIACIPIDSTQEGLLEIRKSINDLLCDTLSNNLCPTVQSIIIDGQQQDVNFNNQLRLRQNGQNWQIQQQ